MRPEEGLIALQDLPLPPTQVLQLRQERCRIHLRAELARRVRSLTMVGSAAVSGAIGAAFRIGAFFSVVSRGEQVDGRFAGNF